MKTMTIRSVEPELSEQIRKAAEKEKKSINQLVIDIMKKHFGLEKEKKFTKSYSDLDHLFGKWSQEEFDYVQGKIDSERQIDRELWK